VCFEEMTASEESRNLVAFCCACGNNLHKDCIQRWQKASSGSGADCPLCREAWREPTRHVAPGEPLPLPKAKTVGRVASASSRGPYLNLAAFT